MTATIDLNADLGEGLGGDDAMLQIVSSASIACGGHAGDSESVRNALQKCLERGVRVGAHPGYADKVHFGRFRVMMPLDQTLAQVRSQMIFLRQLAGEVGVKVRYVKLHGALANQAAEELALGVAIFGTVQAMEPHLKVLALDNSQQVRAAAAIGAEVIREAYADRAYTPAGLLVDRQEPGAVIEDIDAVVERCVRLAFDGEIVAIDGSVFKSQAKSICLHGDTPGAVAMAEAIRSALEARGIAVGASD